MSLDIRIPIGLMFSIIGAILAIFGALTRSNSEMYRVHSLGINVNLGWGCVLLAFGLFMLMLAYIAKHRSSNRGDSP